MRLYRGIITEKTVIFTYPIISSVICTYLPACSARCTIILHSHAQTACQSIANQHTATAISYYVRYTPAYTRNAISVSLRIPLPCRHGRRPSECTRRVMRIMMMIICNNNIVLYTSRLLFSAARQR